ncbi:pentatricopeptide repeat domain-containing protein [Cystoisospora suis]|uniref:Pentatricopeptide repeat domain-containing protein n=1 Tax=Cystoisospora suis TaxID=483139 RepID=A0A2C6KZB4_9APIC|nr:pentatricopeptide repeat domain-containing protein [Cystoisospora suis]
MIHLSTSHELLDNRDGQSKEESLKGEEERSPGNKILNEGEQEEDGFKRNREEGLEKHEALIVPSVLSSHQETCSSPPYQSAMATSSSSSVVSSSPSSPRAAESDPSANSLILSPLSCSSSSSPHETSQAKMTKEEREGGDYLLDAGGELIRQLKKQALEYEATGVDPSLLEVLSSVALPYYPGIERQVRLKEMKSLAKMSFSDLLSLTMKSPSPEGQRGEAKNSVNPLLGEGSGISLCVKNCNALIKAKAHEGDLEGALEIYEKMIQHSLFPDEETFVHLIYGAGKKKDPAAARLLFLKMRSSFHTIEPTNRIYSSLIQAHVLSHDLSSAFALLRKMEDENLQPDCVIYTSLIDGLIKEKKIKKAWRLFWNLRTWKKIEPDEVLFTIMIKACALKGESERALNLLDDLRQSGLYPTDITYMEVIHACCDRKDFASKCFEFYHQMKAEDMPITLPVYSFLLRACVTTGNVKRAKNIVREMIERRIPLNSYIYSLLIRAFASAMRLPHVNDHERCANIRYAWYLLQDMRIKKIPIEVKTLNALLEVYIAGGFAQYAVDLLKYFPQFECEPDIYTYKALLTMFAKDLKDVGRFFALWTYMRTHTSLRPSPGLLHMALETAIVSQSAKQTLKILQEMYSLKVYPTPQLTARLVRVGRDITAIHHMIGLFIQLEKKEVYDQNRKTQQLIQTEIDEYELKTFQEKGVTISGKGRNATPEQEVRKEFFKKKGKLEKEKYGGNRRPWLPLGEYLQSKQKGGEAYALKHDKPRPPLIPAESE